jgi:hypothetical protein
MNFTPSPRKIKPDLRSLFLLLIACLSMSVQGETRFEISNDGQEVLDTQTQLVWKRCPEGMTWEIDHCQGEATYWMWHEALALAVQATKSTGKLWRVPNVKELYSIIDLTQPEMAINLQAFPATPNGQFWSSSHYAQDTFFAWVVHFWYGSAYFSYLEDLSAVRLVRDAEQGFLR